MKAEVSLEFYCYIDADGMMKYIRKPEDKENKPAETDQEELNLEGKDKGGDAATDEEPEVLEAIQEAVEEATEGSNEPVTIEGDKVAQPVTLSSLQDGLFTGKKLKGQIVCSKEEMRDLLDAEREGLRPLFILSIK